MAYLTLSGRDGVVTDTLPAVCMACGRTATVFDGHTFRGDGRGQSIRVRVPRCNQHKDLPTSSGPMLQVVAGVLVLTAGAMLLPAMLARGEATKLQLLLLFLSAPVSLLAGGLLIWSRQTTPSDNSFPCKVSDVTEHGITFHDVSETFVAAYRKEQGKRTDEMTGGSLQNE